MTNIFTVFNLINTLIYLIPTISPILLRTDTNKFNFLTYPTICAGLIISPLVFYYRIDLVISSVLLSFYILMISLGIFLFTRKYDYVKAVSLAVTLGFVASGIWEYPINIYTIFYRGYIDRAFPLHALHIVPLLLLAGEIKVKASKNNILILLSMICFNCIMLMLHISIHGYDIYSVHGIPDNILLWFCRPVTVFTFYSIYYRSGELIKR